MKRLFYYSEFKDVAENSVRIEIYKDSDTEVSATELLLSADTAQIECDADSLFSPIKVSELTLNVLTKDVLKELYTAKANEVSAKVFRNGVLFWFGYLSPNVYSSDYTDETNLLSLEFVDTLSQLDYFKYRYVDTFENKSYIRSFHAIITSILDRIDSERVINEIYLSNSLQINGSNDVLGKMMIQERNFFDESDEADTCKNVLSEIIKYLSMTMIQYENKYLILDYDSIKNGNDKYVKYDRTTGANELVTLPINEVIINKNIHEANAAISLGEVYNKIVVIGNNNPVSNTVPELFSNDDLENQNADKNKYYEIIEDEYVYLSAYFNNNKWHTEQVIGIEEITAANVDSINKGSFFQKNDSYKKDDNEPSSINWKNAVTCASTHYSGRGDLPKDRTTEYKFLSYTNNFVIFKGGFFIINFEYLFNNHSLFANTNTDKDVPYTERHIGTGLSGYDIIQYFEDTSFKCFFKIGDYAWNGEEWTTDMNNGYFHLTHANKKGELIFNSWKALTNQVSYKDDLIESEEGILIPLPKNKLLFGGMELTLYTPKELGDYALKIKKEYNNENVTNIDKLNLDKWVRDAMYESRGVFNSYVRYCHIQNLKLTYTNSDNFRDIFSKEKYDADIKFENVVNEDYVNDFEDLELQVNTYSEKAGSYSYVIERVGESYDYIGNILNLNTRDRLKQEEHIITKYYNYFSSPKYIYSNILNNVDIKPYSLLFENTLGKNFFLNKWVLNLGDNSIEVTANEV